MDIAGVTLGGRRKEPPAHEWEDETLSVDDLLAKFNKAGTLTVRRGDVLYRITPSGYFVEVVWKTKGVQYWQRVNPGWDMHNVIPEVVYGSGDDENNAPKDDKLRECCFRGVLAAIFAGRNLWELQCGQAIDIDTLEP